MNIFKLGFVVLMFSTSVALAMKEDTGSDSFKENNSHTKKNELIFPEGWTQGMELENRKWRGFYYKFSSIKVEGKEVEKNHILSTSKLKLRNGGSLSNCPVEIPYQETKFGDQNAFDSSQGAPYLVWSLENRDMDYKSYGYDMLPFLIDKDRSTEKQPRKIEDVTVGGDIMSVTIHLMHDWFKYKIPPVSWEITRYK